MLRVAFFIDRHIGGERAILVSIRLASECGDNDDDEFKELVLAAGCAPKRLVSASRQTPDPKMFVGSGKLEEIRSTVQELCAEVIIFNHELSASQERNLERHLHCKVLDRTSLILDIFAQRARTYEGKLQVELAQLEHLSSRLVRGWTHLERQQGGIGTRGPGETQLESDRRIIRDRIKALKKRLQKVSKQRDQSRRRRARSRLPVISLVGYTNVGKSMLFNRLTHADVLVKDQLFATLDPTMRKRRLSDEVTVIFADTVGFLSNLPHRLIEAFKATLEEVTHATLLLHIVDVTAQDIKISVGRVNEVLCEIGVEGMPRLMVYNKIDSNDTLKPRIDRDAYGMPVAVWVSAFSGAGIDDLNGAVIERMRWETCNRGDGYAQDSR